MKEFKFRAWEFGKMYYNVMCGGLDETAPTVFIKNGDNWDWVNLTGGEHTKVMQYTGLKDKNGKEIFEGDVLEYTFEGKTNIDVIVYKGNMFTYENSIRWNLQKDKVIGNIYENKDLLETE
jgi:uncharacterized phage protein (TIGR01671 family)